MAQLNGLSAGRAMGVIPTARLRSGQLFWTGPVHIAQTIKNTAVAMITTVSHPRILETRPLTPHLTIFRLLHINISTISSGTATTPFKCGRSANDDEEGRYLGRDQADGRIGAQVAHFIRATLLAVVTRRVCG